MGVELARGRVHSWEFIKFSETWRKSETQNRASVIAGIGPQCDLYKNPKSN